MPRSDRALINSANASRHGFWTEERTIVLRFLWRCGMVAADIATVIGDGCTREMVIGKANRLHLKARPNWHGKRRQLIRISRETKRDDA